MNFSIGQKVTVKTGTIVSVTKYPHLDLTYYCVKVYEPSWKSFNLIYVEEKKLKKLMNLDPNTTSDTHIQSLTDNEP